MPQRNWKQYFHPRAGTDTPGAFLLVYAAVSGAALSLSYTGFYLSLYSWICVGILMVVVLRARPAVAFGCGFLHGLFFVLTSVPWIATVLSVHGGLSPAGGWGVLLLIAAVWGILTGSFAWCVRRLAQKSILFACIGAPFFWVTFEFARAHLPEISFPWNLLGYPASNNLGLLQLTTVTGIYGLSFLVAGFNALIAWADLGRTESPQKRVSVLLLASAAVLLILAIGPRLVPEVTAQHYARGVQTNFPEADEYPPDWFPKHAADLDELEKLSLEPTAHHPDLLVWPEAPAPFSFQDPNFARIASNLAQHFGHPFLAGVIEWKPIVGPSPIGQHTVLAPYNGAILLNAEGQPVFTYDKVHLVPFGEYEPFPLIHRVVTSVSSEVGGFQKGTKRSVGELPDKFRFGVFICYEAIYAGEIRQFAASGANLYINISNDGWFGHSAAAEQHLRMARVRAVENRRWLLRVTNNGYTVSVDPYGRIIGTIPRDVRAAADLPYDFRTDETFYTRFGDWFAWLCVIVSVILVATTFMKGKGTVSQELFVTSEIPHPLVASEPGGAVSATGTEPST